MNHVATNAQPTGNPGDRARVFGASSWGDTPRTTAAQSLDLGSMRLLARDHEILRLVSRFGQLTTAQIDALVFHELKSRSPCRVAIQRLVKHELLEPVAQRLPGGRLGGSAMNVLQIGREGWPLFFEGRRRFSRVIRAHSLAIADVFVETKKAERAGVLDVLDYATEPDSHIDVGGADLRPDLFIDIGLPHKGERVAMWLEVDLGSERQKQIIAKIEDYKLAYEHSDQYPLDVFPTCLFLATEPERVREIRNMVKRVRGVPDGLIDVAGIEEFPSILQR